MFRPRQATEADLEILHDIDRACFPTSDPQAVQGTPEGFRSGVGHGDILLAEWDGDPVGFVHSAATPQRVVVEALAVLPEARRRGIGRRLLKEVLRPLNICDIPFYMVEAVTSPENTAMVGLLTSQGFSAGELVRDHFGPGRHRLIFHWYSRPPDDLPASDPDTLSAVLRAGYRVTGSHAAADGAYLELSKTSSAAGPTEVSAGTGGLPTGTSRATGVVRNAEAPWADFNPIAYWKRNYLTLLPVDREILTLTCMHFMGFLGQPPLPRSTGGLRALDIGTGANLYPALAMLPLVDRITLGDLSPANINWLRESLGDTTEPWPWASFWQHVSSCARRTDRAWDYRPDRDVRRELDERAELWHGSIFDLPRASWNIGTMFFVAESITEDLDEFSDACASFLRALRPGAPFAAAFMAGSSGYRIDNTSFPAVMVTYTEIRDVLKEHVDAGRLQMHEFLPSPEDTVRDHQDENGYSSMVLALGTIREDRQETDTTETGTAEKTQF